MYTYGPIPKDMQMKVLPSTHEEEQKPNSNSAVLRINHPHEFKTHAYIWAPYLCADQQTATTAVNFKVV